MEILRRLLEMTAWEMTKPEPYGAVHIMILVIGLPICWLCARVLARRSHISGEMVLFWTGVVLAVAEVYKQFFRFTLLDGGVYDWSMFPFQLCSVPMYLCLFARGRQWAYEFLASYNLLGGIMALLSPPGLCHEYWTLTLHAFVWHLLLVFLGLYLRLSGLADCDRRSFWRSTKVFLLLCVVAFSINLLFWETSAGDINMFYIGPKPSSQLVFSTIAERFGWYIGTAVYIPAVILGAYMTQRLLRHIKPVARFPAFV